ncbi:hypothetical protein VN12_26780 [Pirellula sp. SH-Sr6A]|uniref:hypothetical protein n=1 Tax=Pirellula sp. SH-Sr6A TaxID=1632865 RepID=UPI00078C4781|nr:hypothetical protein [Pirellula sp. SH-Sr6A]AMV35727.1 hypothetical protein VN12_26780 [Pirellula sp. SH-Sr6A]
MWFAQAALGDIGQILQSVGVPGVLVWYLWHNTTKTIPDLVAQHQATIAKLTEDFSKALESERVARKVEVDELRDWIRDEAACKLKNIPPGATCVIDHEAAHGSLHGIKKKSD